MSDSPDTQPRHRPWNKGRLVGQKPALKLKEIWSIRIRLQISAEARDLAMFNLAIDSKLRACDLIGLQVNDVTMGSQIRARAVVMQRKTGRPVQFELSEQTRESVPAWILEQSLRNGDPLFPSRKDRSGSMGVRQYARLVDRWVSSIGLDPLACGTHSMRRTKAALIYRRMGNLRAVQLLLGHTKLESTVRYLGIEVGDALAIAEQIEI
jgi:integrase